MADYYLSTLGDDANSGTTPTSAKATFAAAVALLTTAGDRLNIMADGVHDITGHDNTVIPDTGTLAAPNVVRGVNASGTADGTRATMTWPQGVAGLFHARAFYTYEDIIFSNFVNNDIFSATNIILRRLRTVVDSGRLVRSSSNRVLAVDCEHLTTRTTFNSGANSQTHIYVRCYSVSGFAAGGDRGGWSFLDCVSNIQGAGTNFNMSAVSSNAQNNIAKGCVAIGGTTGFLLRDQNATLQNCTAVNASGNGINMIASSNGVAFIEDCIIANNGGYGIGRATAQFLHERNNIFYNNTSGDIQGMTIDPSSQNIDPELSALFTPGAAAVLNRVRSIGRGPSLDPLLTYTDAGGIQTQCTGGGGGGTRVISFT